MIITKVPEQKGGELPEEEPTGAPQEAAEAAEGAEDSEAAEEDAQDEEAVPAQESSTAGKGFGGGA